MQVMNCVLWVLRIWFDKKHILKMSVTFLQTLGSSLEDVAICYGFICDGLVAVAFVQERY